MVGHMIQVEPISPPRATGRVGRSRTDGTFLVTDGATPSPARPTATAELEATSLVSLQEAVAPATAQQRDRAARGRCDRLVSALAMMQRAWLGGMDASGALDSLSTLTAEPLDADDPGLLATLTGAVTRARVELARNNRC